MRRERLEQLTLDELKKIAHDIDIPVPDDIDRETLIKRVCESYDEREEEREFDNVSVKIEGMKYRLSRDEELDVRDSEEIVLPDSYGTTRIILMARDPYWAFAYWEIDKQTLRRIKTDQGFEGLLLRVHDIKLIDFNGNNSNFYFDIPVLLNDGKWYINVPHPDSVYIIQLLYSSNGEKKFIAQSNVINSPRENISGVIDNEWIAGSTDKIIDLIRKDFASFHPASAGIPQRIISFVSSSYIPYG
ncbi:MAG: DUF4912 domain-containing protein [Spirochaetales bacterium]|nr:DUF4912 domain-containing protein [Spirochaetales bacterium]